MKTLVEKNSIDADIEEFDSWAANPTQGEYKSIEKDVHRSKMAQYRDYPHILEKTQCLLGCYCAKHNLPYQQGMHEVRSANKG